MINVLRQSDTCKLVLRELEAGDMTNEEVQSSLHILVNLSSDETFAEKFYEINAATRIARLFLAKVDNEIKVKPLPEDNLFSLDLDLALIGDGILLSSNTPIDKSLHVRKVLDKYILNEFKVGSGLTDLSTVPYLLMILNNLTVSEKGQTQFFGSDKKELDGVQGLIFLKMLDKYFEHIFKPEMDFFSAIIANVSALKEGRLFILEHKIFGVILNQFDKLNNIKIVNMLRVFRNCCFEFEKYEEDLMSKEGFMIGLIFKILLETNLPKNETFMEVSSLDSIYLSSFVKEKAEEERETINDLIIDIFVVLTNTTTAFPLVVKKGLKSTWSKIRMKLVKQSELEDRLFVITNFLDSHN